MNPAEAGDSLTTDSIRLICHPNYGVGSDGILLGPFEGPGKTIALKIFNPDGSQAEKSGNGLRIFTRYLYDKGLIGGDRVTIHTAGGLVQARVFEDGKLISEGFAISMTGTVTRVAEGVIHPEMFGQEPV